MPVRTAAGRAAMPESRWKPIAAPRNSARSVAIAIASACSQRTNETRRGKLLAADLRQVPARGDAELRGQRLDQHRHQVRGDDHPDELVPVLRAAGDVRREVARVDVRDAGDERRPDERQEPETGNFATNIAAGSRYGYQLVWVIVAANLMAMLIQTTVREAWHRHAPRTFPRSAGSACPVTSPSCSGCRPRRSQWRTDLAEFLGGAMASTSCRACDLPGPGPVGRSPPS